MDASGLAGGSKFKEGSDGRTRWRGDSSGSSGHDSGWVSLLHICR